MFILNKISKCKGFIRYLLPASHSGLLGLFVAAVFWYVWHILCFLSFFIVFNFLFYREYTFYGKLYLSFLS